jgi:hypothetical protein
VTGRVEDAVRRAVAPGVLLATPAGRGAFTVDRYTTDGLVLLLGKKEAWTPLPWRAMEGIPHFLRARGWVAIGSLYSTDSQPGSLDEYLKGFLEEGHRRLGRGSARAGGSAHHRPFPAGSRQAAFRLVGRCGPGLPGSGITVRHGIPKATAVLSADTQV